LLVRTKNTADTATKTNRQPFFLPTQKALLTPHENELSAILPVRTKNTAATATRTNRQPFFLSARKALLTPQRKRTVSHSSCPHEKHC